MYLGEDPLGLKFCRELWTSETWMFISFPRFGKFSAIISLQKLSVHFPLPSPAGSPVIHRLFLLMVSYSSCRLSSFVFILFYLFSCDWIVSNDLSSISQILSSTCSNLMAAALCCIFHFLHYILQLQNLCVFLWLLSITAFFGSLLFM